jgi:tripartite motif-containing protein 37
LKLSDIFAGLKGEVTEHLGKLSELNKVINHRAVQIKGLIDGLSQEATESTHATLEFARQAQDAIEAAYNRYHESLQAKVRTLRALRNEADALQVSACCVPRHPAKARELIAKIEQLQGEIEEQLTPVERPQVIDDFVPPFQEAVFVIPRIQEEIAAAQLPDAPPFVYTRSQRMYGNKWRLKVYPNGNNNARSMHVSVFLELRKGPRDGGWQSFKLEITGSGTAVVKEHREKFMMGESWGWNKTVSVENVLNGNYVTENGELHIRISLRPETYGQASRQMEYAVRHKKEKYRQLKLAAQPPAEAA